MPDAAFNLIDSPWIPVLMTDGSTRLVGLSELFSNAQLIADFSVHSDERIALLRLVMCIVYASMGTREWSAHMAQIENNAVTYLTDWHDRFWLFHDRYPFLQIPDLQPASRGADARIPITKLDFSLATGNNALWNDHGGKILNTPEIALRLLTFQCFAPGGASSVVLWTGEKTARHITDAPCICGSMLHCYVRARNLSRTLRTTIPSPSLFRRRYELELPTTDLGRPIWEKIPTGPDDAASVSNATETLIGRLVPLSRAILIQGDSMLLGEALVYPNYTSNVTFPEELTATVVKKRSQEGLKLLSFDPDISMWRMIPSFLTKFSDPDHARGPLTLSNLGNMDSADESLDIVVAGVCRDQAAFTEADTFVYPIRPTQLTDIGRLTFETGLGIAEKYADRLRYALKIYKSAISSYGKSPEKQSDRDSGNTSTKAKKKVEKSETNAANVRSDAVSYYWSVSEQYLQILFDAANADTDEAATARLKLWAALMHNTAYDAYRTSAAISTGRQMRAFVLGLRCLQGNKKIHNLCNMDNTESVASLEKLLKFLELNSNDRGLMATMRNGLRDTGKTAVWPVLAKFCNLKNEPEAVVFRTVAGLYAMHPETCRGTSIGKLCLQLCDPDEAEKILGDGLGDGPRSRQFQRLLNADPVTLPDHIIRMVQLAHSRGIPVDYLTLGRDMLNWNGRTKISWAQDFWGSGQDARTNKEVDGACNAVADSNQNSYS